MIDRPTAPDLLSAMAETLSTTVVPACEGAPQHSARVVANLCRILAREWDAGPDATARTVADMATLLEGPGDDGDLSSRSAEELAELVDQRLAHADPALAGADVHAALLANVERRLAVAKPSYLVADSASADHQ